jgi:hypothetical protein
MRKIAVLALLVLLVPAIAAAQPGICFKEGDPGLYVDFGMDTDNIIAGATNVYTIGCANFGFVSICGDPDTFCCDIVLETAGWTVVGAPPLGTCMLLDPGYLWWQEISVTAPCEVEPCDYDTLIVGMFYCRPDPIDTLVCDILCGGLPECENPNWYGGNPYYELDTLIIHVVESPPALYILQDSIYFVDQGQTAAYIPFSICNGDPCADAQDYGYCISNKGWVGGPILQCDTITGVPGGECGDVYGIIDAGLAEICDYDTLTIIAWSVAVPIVYDTCVQLIHVVEAEPVPLFTAPVVTILVLALVLAAAVFMRRRAVSRA